MDEIKLKENYTETKKMFLSDSATIIHLEIFCGICQLKSVDWLWLSIISMYSSSLWNLCNVFLYSYFHYKLKL